MNFSHLLKMYEIPVPRFAFSVTRSYFVRANCPRIVDNIVFFRFAAPPFCALLRRV